jgi:hypothetical protein
MMADKVSKECHSKKTLENLGEIYITETDLQTKENHKKKVRLFKFVSEEKDYYTEDQLKYLNNMFSEKLKKTMQNIFTYQTESLRKQMIYTAICKSLGEGKVSVIVDKYKSEDRQVLDGLLDFIRNELQEYKEELNRVEEDFKNSQIDEKKYNDIIGEFKEKIEILETALKRPEENEVTDEDYEIFKENYDYFAKILKEAYDKDLNNKKIYREYIDFYKKALENGTSEIKESENKEFS